MVQNDQFCNRPVFGKFLRFKRISFALLLSATAAFAAMPTQAAEPSKQMQEFLNFERKNQDGFIATSILMLGVIAAQTNPSIADCVNVWYQGNEETKERRHTEIIKVMRQYQQYVPTTIVLSVVERECGKFKRTK